VLAFLAARFGARIAKVHLDMKASITEIYLEGAMPDGVIPMLEAEFAADERLRFWPKGAVSCPGDFTSIEWSAESVAPAPLKPWWKIW